MKTLILIRHAKAVEKGLLIDDHGRKLVDKGKKQVKRLVEIIKKLKIKTDYIISSDSARTIQTAQPVSDYLGLQLVTSSTLYFEGLSAYFDVLKKLDSGSSPEGQTKSSEGQPIDTCIIVGHNNDMTDFICHCLNVGFVSVSKGSMTIIDFDVEEWKDVERKDGKLKLYIAP